MNDTLNRIGRKFLHYLNLVIGNVYDTLQHTGLIGQFPYRVVANYGVAENFTHAYPHNFIKDDASFFEEWKSYKTFPHDLYLMNNVTITHEGIVLKKHSVFIKALPHPIFRFKFGPLYNIYIRLFYKEHMLDKRRNYLLLFDHWSSVNYFHWVVDSLCRAYMATNNIGFEFTILLPENPPAYVLDSLEKFNILDIIYIPRNSFVKTNQLYSINYAAWSGQQHPVILNKTKEYIVSKTKPEQLLQYKRIYASRSRQKTRRVINEDEVITIVTKHGFTVVYFDDMTFDAQVALMQNVQFFISSHGANITNILFLPTNAKVLELINNKKPNFCYWSVASFIHIEYNYQLCNIHSADHIIVDIAKLEENIQAISN
jgi:hypothetical protein